MQLFMRRRGMFEEAQEVDPLQMPPAQGANRAGPFKKDALLHRSLSLGLTNEPRRISTH
jgi:hypothetical protein